MATDKERLDWLESAEGCALLSDDFGNWAVSTAGMQNIPDPIPERGKPAGIHTSFMVDAGEWKASVRDAIDAAMSDRPMMPKQRASKLIGELLEAQISNVDPDDFDTIHARWLWLIANEIEAALREATELVE